MPFPDLKQSRNIKETLYTALAFVRSEFKPLAFALLYIAGPLVLLSAWVNYRYFNDVFGVVFRQNTPEGFVDINIFSPRYLLLMFTQLLLNTVIFLVTLFYIRERIDTGRAPGIGRLWNLVLNDIGAYFAYVAALFMLIVFGFSFLIVPGIWLTVVTSVFLPVVIFERRSFGDAFVRCFYLIKNNWWATFRLILLTMVILYLFNIALQIPLTLIGRIAGLNIDPDTLNNTMDNGDILFILFAQLSQLTFSFLFVVLSCHYFSLNEKKRGNMRYGDTDAFYDPPLE